MHARGRGFCKKRDLAAGLGVMLVGKGGAADEGGGDSPSSSGFLQSVGLLGWGRCAAVVAVTGASGQNGGTRGRLRWFGLLQLKLVHLLSRHVEAVERLPSNTHGQSSRTLTT